MMECLSSAILVDLTGVCFGCLLRVLVFLLPHAVFQIYNSAGNMLAAFQICSSACSSEYCTKGCLILRSFKHILDLVQKTYKASYADGVLSFRYRLFFFAFNIFFKLKMLWHLLRYCTIVISSLPVSLMVPRTVITSDFCGLDFHVFQQVFHEFRYYSVTFFWTVEMQSTRACCLG